MEDPLMAVVGREFLIGLQRWSIGINKRGVKAICQLWNDNCTGSVKRTVNNEGTAARRDRQSAKKEAPRGWVL